MINHGWFQYRTKCGWGKLKEAHGPDLVNCEIEIQRWTFFPVVPHSEGIPHYIMSFDDIRLLRSGYPRLGYSAFGHKSCVSLTPLACRES